MSDLDIVQGNLDDYEDAFEDNEIEVSRDEELAMGLKVPTSMKVPSSYLDGLRKYQDVYNDIYKQMEVCNKLYKYNSIIGNAVDVLLDFAVTPVHPLPTGEKKLDLILNDWFETVNEDNTNTMPGIYALCQEFGLEWFTAGNAFPYSKWTNKQITGVGIEGTYKVPSNVTLLNPASIEIPKGPIAFGQEVIYLKYDSELLDKLSKDGRSDPEAALIKQAIPRSILRSLQTRGRGFEGVRLNPKYISHLKRRAKGYQAWGVPYLSRCFSSASILEKLRELDESVASGLLNLVTIFKVGTEEHPASNSRLRKFAALLRNPKHTQTLVWAHDVEIEQVGPDGKLLQMKTKYQDAKEDLLIALGVPPVLMSLSQSGDEWVAILALVERLSYWRNTVSLWIEKQCNDIAKFNGFNKKVKVKWERMNLTDEQAVKNLVLSFYDRGLISINTTLQDSGYNMEREVNAKKEEKSLKEQFVRPDIPYAENPSQQDGRPKNTKDKQKVVKKAKSEPTVNDKVKVKKDKPKAPKKII